jgi:hypothetical protein
MAVAAGAGREPAPAQAKSSEVQERRDRTPVDFMRRI